MPIPCPHSDCPPATGAGMRSYALLRQNRYALWDLRLYGRAFVISEAFDSNVLISGLFRTFHLFAVLPGVFDSPIVLSWASVSTIAVWDKLWKSRRSCLEKFALGRSRGKSDFPKGRSPEGKSDYPRDLPWANFHSFYLTH